MWKARGLFTGAVVLSILFALIYQNPNIGFTMLYILVLMLAISVLSILFAPLFIDIEEQLNESAISKNQSLIYSTTIHNRSFFYYPKVQQHYFTSDIILYKELGRDTAPLSARSFIVNRSKVKFPYRGVYDVGLESIVLTDFLGLFQRRIDKKRPLPVTVYPAFMDDFTLKINEEPLRSVMRQDILNEDYSSVADVRKFEENDSLKKVHWKLSAKRGEMVVKNFNSFEPNKAVLFVDRLDHGLKGEDQLKMEDTITTYVASAINFCLKNSLSVRLIYGAGAREELTMNATYDQDRGFRLLAGISFDEPNTQILGLGQNTEGSFGTILFLTTIDTTIYKVIQTINAVKKSVVVYYFYNAKNSNNQEQRLFLDSLKKYGAAINEIQIAE